MNIMTRDLARILEHTKLQPYTTREELGQFCEVVKKYQFATAYVLPANLSIVAPKIDQNVTKLGTGIGFPFGTHTTKTKLVECEGALELGAEEIDVVINIGALKSGDFNYVTQELQKIVQLASPHIVKVILEVSYLTKEEIVIGAKVCCDVNAAFVKAATGYGQRATTLDDIRLLAQAVNNQIGVKASGGVRDVKTILEMYKLGARRFGVSRGDTIMEEFIRDFNGQVVIENHE